MDALGALAALLLGAAGAAAGPAVPAPVPESVRSLVAAERALATAKLQAGGRMRIEAVRHRLAALAALEGAARKVSRGEEIRARLLAHLVVGRAHRAFHEELASAPAPDGAQGPAAGAWAGQLDETLRRTSLVALANLRSCEALAKSSKMGEDVRKLCAAERAILEPGRAAPSRSSPQAAAKERSGELQPCIDRWAAEHPRAEPLEVHARVGFDSLGRVDSVQLTPAAQQGTLYDCLSNGLWLWVLPELADAELEIPLKVRVPSR